MKQNTFNLLLLGLAFVAEKINPTSRDPQCMCDPKKFLENEDCSIHLKAKTSHLFALIKGDSNRPYYEASPITDIYECEQCGMQANTVWLQEHPEAACPESNHKFAVGSRLPPLV